MSVIVPLLIGACQQSNQSNAPASPQASSPTTAQPSPIQHQSPSAWPTSRAREVALGFVSALAVTQQAVFALYTPPGTEGVLNGARNTMVARIDRVSGVVLKAGPFPGALRIAVGFGSVWVGAGNLFLPSPDPQAVDLVKLDADSLTVRARISLPPEKVQYPLVVEPAAGTTGLWVAYGAHIYNLDPLADSVSHSWSIDGVVSSIALSPGGDRLYVGAQTSSDPWATISAWDTTTMNRLVSVSTGGGGMGGPEVVAGTDKVWVAYATGMMGQIEERRASDLADLHAKTPAFSNSISVQVAGGFVLFTDGMSGRIGCLDPQTGTVLSTAERPFGGVVAGDRSVLFVGGQNGVAELIPAARCRQEAG
jgi:hypothetical protein